MTGKVFIVGAGPGDPELISVKGKRILEECGAVVYDRLIPMELVVALPKRVRRIYVGKSAGKHSKSQDEINIMLAELAEEGLNVVRLKGGDPFIFGRGGEEALYLRNKGIPFEVIPGITAGAAAPAYAGIPVTHRNKAVFTIFLTAHEADEKEEAQIPWQWLSQVRNGTIAGYMGVKRLSAVTGNLIEGGMPVNTPAAVIEKGTTGLQKSVIGTVSDIAEKAEKAQILPPALFVIGEVVELSKEIAWRIPGVLAGKRVMVTRPASQAALMYASLRQLGAEVLPLPAIEIEEYNNEDNWKEVYQQIRISHKSYQDWIIFTSENGVRYFLSQLGQHAMDSRDLCDFMIAVVGTGTEAALNDIGLSADFVPTKATVAALAEELIEEMGEFPGRVIRVKGNLGEPIIEDTLKSQGYNVIPLQVYSAITAEWDEGMFTLLEDNPPDLITFTSGSTVKGFFEILGEERAKDTARRAVIASIGPMTSQTLREYNIDVEIKAEVHSVPGLIDAVKRYFHK
ncbi:MAG: uroporphyrinogen-III C-methyltransferase [FCB group bacterium]|nr:uroporphyrinogen-III C-methyltransferase [FCB group bacterium]